MLKNEANTGASLRWVDQLKNSDNYLTMRKLRLSELSSEMAVNYDLMRKHDTSILTFLGHHKPVSKISIKGLNLNMAMTFSKILLFTTTFRSRSD